MWYLKQSCFLHSCFCCTYLPYKSFAASFDLRSAFPPMNIHVDFTKLTRGQCKTWLYYLDCLPTPQCFTWGTWGSCKEIIKTAFLFLVLGLQFITCKSTRKPKSTYKQSLPGLTSLAAVDHYFTLCYHLLELVILPHCYNTLYVLSPGQSH